MQNAPYQLFDQLKDQIEPGSLFVEIGSDRGGGSTYYLQNLARQTKNDFITVDIDPVYLGSSIKSVKMAGEDWVQDQLPTIGSKVRLVFMDGFDWTTQPTAVRNGTASPDTYNLISDYEKKNLQLNNVNSAMAHILQVIGLLPNMEDKCAIMFCDTWFNYTLDTFEGKGAGAVYMLLAEGYNVLSASYQLNYIMMGRGMNSPAGYPNLDMSKLNKIYSGPKKRPDEILYS